MISENMIKVNQNLLMKYQNKLKRMRGKGQVHYFHILSATMNTISAGQEDVSRKKAFDLQIAGPFERIEDRLLAGRRGRGGVLVGRIALRAVSSWPSSWTRVPLHGVGSGRCDLIWSTVPLGGQCRAPPFHLKGVFAHFSLKVALRARACCTGTTNNHASTRYMG
jgi:hypothetical protein